MEPLRWERVPVERVTEDISRQVVTGRSPAPSW